MANPAISKTFAPERIRSLNLASPLSETRGPVMTLDGVVQKTALMFLLVIAAGYFGWQSVDVVTETVAGLEQQSVQIPGWVIFAMIGGFITAIVTTFKPTVARFSAPIYAVLEGLVLGAISALYNARFDGIVLQAVMLTGLIAGGMLVAYSVGAIRATPKMTKGIILATFGIMGVYLLSFVFRLFGAEIPFVHDSGPFGILFSVVVSGIAAMNLILDFDMIENGVRAGAPKYLEWYSAFGLVVTLVWLYLELLRLLGKLRD